MISRIVTSALGRRSLVLALSAAVLLFGVFQLDKTRVENLPEFNAPYVEVQTEALGLSAYEVEQLITVPLEADLLNGVAFVEDIRSQSMPSLSSIVMTFEPGTNVLDARQLVQERLTQAAGLPNVSRAPSMVQPLSSESRIMMVGLRSDELSLVDLGVLARWTIRPRLMGVDGVANVVIWGQREQQLQVQVDPNTLAELDVPLQDVVRTTGNALWTTPLSFLAASTPGVGGFIDGPNQRIGIRHVPAISTPEDLAQVAVDGRPDLVLGDVATIVQDHQPLIGDAVVGNSDGLYLIIERFAWSNTRDTTAAVDAAIAELQPGLTGVEIQTDLFRPANYLERAIDNVSAATLIALGLVVIVLLLMLGSWKAAAATLVSLLVSITAAAIVLYVADVTINTMLLAGLVVGSLLIIDDSVHNIEEIRRKTNRGPVGIVSGVRSNMTSFAYAAIILTVATVPAFVMEGTAGEFVPEIALAMVLSFVVAFVVGTTVAPALASLFLGGSEASSAADSQALRHLSGWYDAVLGWITGATRAVVAGGIGLLVIGLALTPLLDTEFVPDFRQTDLLISFDAAAGVSLPETRRVASQAADELASIPGVEGVGVQVGRAVLSDEVTNVNGAEIWLKMDPSADYDATFNQIQEVADGYPGFGRPTINTYANDRVNSELQQPGEDLVVRVFGEVPEQLASVTSGLAGSIGGLDGVDNVRPLWPVTEPSVEISVDLERAAEFQVKPGDVRRAAATLLSGIEVGSLFEEQKVFEVVVWSTPETRSSVSSVENLLIDTPSGERITLSSVADVSIGPNQRIIQRDAVSRYIDIVADVSGRSVGSVEDEIRALVNEQGLPYEFHVGFLSARADETSNARQVIAVALAALVTIVLLLQSAFSSWRLAVLLAGASLAALTGSIVAMLIAGGTYSIGSMAGLIVITGVTLRSGIGLFKRYESLQLDQVAELGPTVVREGARQHFAPTMAGLVLVAAVSLPFVFAGNAAGVEVLGPLSIAVLGGVFTSAAVTLLILPACYLWFARPAVAPDFLLTELESGDLRSTEYADNVRTRS